MTSLTDLLEDRYWLIADSVDGWIRLQSSSLIPPHVPVGIRRIPE